MHNWELCDIERKIEDAVDAYIIQKYAEPFRAHLGASKMGSICDRELWYSFRWFKAEKHGAKLLRLFQAGHRFEPILREELRAIGFQFLDTVDVDGVQTRVVTADGHGGGSCDGVFIAPEYGITVPTLLECKTSGTGAKFDSVRIQRMKDAKPDHFIQDSIYGKLLGIRQCLYVLENKNDSSRYYELVELDWELAQQQETRMFRIINSPVPPERYSNLPEAFICKFCTFKQICHEDEVPIPNCRNCANAVPIENAQWGCLHFGQIIPKEYLIKGCPEHRPLPR